MGTAHGDRSRLLSGCQVGVYPRFIDTGFIDTGFVNNGFVNNGFVNTEQLRIPTRSTVKSGLNKGAEQRRRAVRAALELGMGLSTDPIRMALQLDELNEPAVGRLAAQREIALLEALAVLGVEPSNLR